MLEIEKASTGADEILHSIQREVQGEECQGIQAVSYIHLQYKIIGKIKWVKFLICCPVVI